MGGTGLGEAIGRQLVSLGLTQSSLARRAGISQPYLSQLERGTRKRISYGPLRRLADALGVTMTALMEKEASSMPRRGRTEFWLYQLRPRVDWGLPDYLRDVREGRVLAGHWDESASKVYKLGGRPPQPGDLIVLFWAPPDTERPGLCGLAVITDFGAERRLRSELCRPLGLSRASRAGARRSGP